MARSQPSAPAKQLATAAYQRILSILGFEATVPPLFAGPAREGRRRCACDALPLPPTPAPPRYPASINWAMRAGPVEASAEEGKRRPPLRNPLCGNQDGTRIRLTKTEWGHNLGSAVKAPRKSSKSFPLHRRPCPRSFGHCLTTWSFDVRSWTVGFACLAALFILSLACTAFAQAPDPQQLFQEAAEAQQHGNAALAVRKYQELLRLASGDA